MALNLLTMLLTLLLMYIHIRTMYQWCVVVNTIFNIRTFWHVSQRLFSLSSSKFTHVTNSPNITTNAPIGAVIYTHINEPIILNSNP